MLGSQVEVVSPKSIREDIRKEVEKTLKHYQ
jgi:predicted DNA-binding transcriptional regulator YafY